jgi:hypothetical protein
MILSLALALALAALASDRRGLDAGASGGLSDLLGSPGRGGTGAFADGGYGGGDGVGAERSKKGDQGGANQEREVVVGMELLVLGAVEGPEGVPFLHLGDGRGGYCPVRGREDQPYFELVYADDEPAGLAALAASEQERSEVPLGRFVCVVPDHRRRPGPVGAYGSAYGGSATNGAGIRGSMRPSEVRSVTTSNSGISGIGTSGYPTGGSTGSATPGSGLTTGDGPSTGRGLGSGGFGSGVMSSEYAHGSGGGGGRDFGHHEAAASAAIPVQRAPTVHARALKGAEGLPRQVRGQLFEGKRQMQGGREWLGGCCCCCCCCCSLLLSARPDLYL